ncbi:MAG: hypothetical protein HYY26_06195, partial [Acidobacteria bacterium]|nr:hypothetical protein [Acidobacteriota bacterium]
AALTLFSVLWTQTPEWGRIPYDKDWFGVHLISVASAPNTLYIMLGDGSPFSYVIPFLPDSTRMVRLTGNMPLRPETELGREAVRMIATHPGPIRSLAISPLEDADREQLARFGLRLDESDCAIFHSRLDEFTTCRLLRETKSG